MQNPFLSLVVGLLVILVAAGFGRRIGSLLHIKYGGALEKNVFSAGMGLGLLSYLVLGIGLLHVLYAWVLACVLLLMAAVSIGEIRSLLAEAGHAIKLRFKSRLGMGDAAIAFSIVSLGVLGLLGALAPPAGLDWDGLAYHLAVPKIYLRQHSITYIPFVSHSNFPFLTEMLYTLGLAFGSAAAAKIFHFAMFALTGAAIYSFGRRYIGSLAGKIGSLIYLSVPVVFWESQIAYADLSSALYIALAVYAVVNWEETGLGRWLWVAGAAGGFALGTKVLCGIPVAVLCAWVLLASLKRSGWKSGLLGALTLGALSLIVGSPWYIKSFIYTGNPVYPFLFNIFGGRNWTQANADAYRQSQLVFGMGRGCANFLMLPWNLTMNGCKFFDTKSLFGILGPAYLGLAPLVFFVQKKRGLILRLALLSFIFIAAWFVLMQQSRYMIGILPILSVICAAGAAEALQGWRPLRTAVILFLAVCVICTGLMGIFLAQGNGTKVVLGIESKDDYASWTLDTYDAQIYINKNAPANAGVAMFGEVRGFYLDRDYIWANPGHHEMIPWARFSKGPDMVNFLIKSGYTYAIINWRFFSPETDCGRIISDAIGRGIMCEEYASHAVSVYSLRSE